MMLVPFCHVGTNLIIILCSRRRLVSLRHNWMLVPCWYHFIGTILIIILSIAQEDAVLVAHGLMISAETRRVVWIAYADVGWKICDKCWSSNSMSDVSSFDEVSVWCFARVEWYWSQSVYSLEAVTVATSNSLFSCPKWCFCAGVYAILVSVEVTHR